MTKKFNQFIVLAGLLVVLPSCSTYSLNPFSSGAKEQSRGPQGAVAYACEGNHQFYVRMLNNGNDAWLIYPDHEVNLTKSADNKNLYTSGIISLSINSNETTLNDGEKIAYVGCQPQVKSK